MDFYKKNRAILFGMIFIMFGAFFLIIGNNERYFGMVYRLRYPYNLILENMVWLGEIIGFVFIAIAFFLLLPKLAFILTPFTSFELGVTKSDRYVEEIQQAIDRIQDQPDKAKPAWDLARVRLEMYFDRNLSQINYIFWLSVVVLVVGFSFILYGINQSFIASSVDLNKIAQMIENTENPDAILSMVTQASNTSGMVATLAGVITEFIGATFLFIYKSTINQATSYTETLERINSVGMAMQILDTISNESKELQDKTKSEIVKSLLGNTKGNSSASQNNNS